MSNETETEPSPYPAPGVDSGGPECADDSLRRDSDDCIRNKNTDKNSNSNSNKRENGGSGDTSASNTTAAAAPSATHGGGGGGSCHFYFPSTSTCDQTSSTITGTASSTITPLSGGSHETSPAVPLPKGKTGETDNNNNHTTHSTPIQEPPSKLMHREPSVAHLTDLSEAAMQYSGHTGVGGSQAKGEESHHYHYDSNRTASRERKVPLGVNIRRGSHATHHNTAAAVVAVAPNNSNNSNGESKNVSRDPALVVSALLGSRRRRRVTTGLASGATATTTSVPNLQRSRLHRQQQRQQRRQSRRQPTRSHSRDSNDSLTEDGSDWEDAEEWNARACEENALNQQQQQQHRQSHPPQPAKNEEEQDGAAIDNEEDTDCNNNKQQQQQRTAVANADAAPTSSFAAFPVPSHSHLHHRADPLTDLSYNKHQHRQVFRPRATAVMSGETKSTSNTITTTDVRAEENGVSSEEEPRTQQQQLQDTHNQLQQQQQQTPPPLLFDCTEPTAPLVIPLTESRFARSGISRFVSMLCARSATEPIPKSDFHSHCLPSMSVKLYVERLERYCTCSGEALLCGLLLMLRYTFFSGHPVTIYNAHRLLITSTVLGIKMRDDLYYNNVYYARIGGISAREMNKLEVLFLSRLDWHMDVSPEDYAQLRSILTKLTENVREKEGFLARFAQQHPAAVEAFVLDDDDAKGEGGEGTRGGGEAQATTMSVDEERHLRKAEGAYWGFYWDAVVAPWLAELQRRCFQHVHEQRAVDGEAWQTEEAKWRAYRQKEEEEKQGSEEGSASSRWMSPTSVTTVHSLFPAHNPNTGGSGEALVADSGSGCHRSSSGGGFASNNGNTNSTNPRMASTSLQAAALVAPRSHSAGLAKGNGGQGAPSSSSSSRYANFVSYNNSTVFMHNSSGGGFPTIRDATGHAAVVAAASHGSAISPSRHSGGGHNPHRSTSSRKGSRVGGQNGSYGPYNPSAVPHHPQDVRSPNYAGPYPPPAGVNPTYTGVANGSAVCATAAPTELVGGSSFGIGDRVREHVDGKNGNNSNNNNSVVPRATSPHSSTSSATLSEQKANQADKDDGQEKADASVSASSKLNVNAQPYQYVSRRQRLQQQQQHQGQPQPNVPMVVEVKGGGERNSFVPRGSTLGMRQVSSGSLTGASFRPTNDHNNGSFTANTFSTNGNGAGTGNSSGNGGGAQHIRFTSWRSSESIHKSANTTDHTGEAGISSVGVVGRKRPKPDCFQDQK